MFVACRWGGRCLESRRGSGLCWGFRGIPMGALMGLVLLGSVSPSISLSLPLSTSWPFTVSIPNTCSPVLSLFLSSSCSLFLRFPYLTCESLFHCVITSAFPQLWVFLSLPPVYLSVSVGLSISSAPSPLSYRLFAYRPLSPLFYPSPPTLSLYLS